MKKIITASIILALSQISAASPINSYDQVKHKLLPMKFFQDQAPKTHEMIDTSEMDKIDHEPDHILNWVPVTHAPTSVPGPSNNRPAASVTEPSTLLMMMFGVMTLMGITINRRRK